MSAIIQVEKIGKKYILSHQRQSYYALRDVMADSVKRWGRKIIHPLASRRDPDPTHEEFWALKDVSFEINQGDRVGIIGRNGAGKSTLLKILSRITESTRGRVTLRGRVASLLEVGTGFHPELTGRENVYLNGAILGMSKANIKRKFDEIVAFAEVEKFLDTPVKRYSSGMYVRLAFAVAAHLEPEILIIDEVLAVGDAQFQKKCLGKMGEVGKEGRTVLFVSHNMTAIQNLCTNAIVLKNGRILTTTADVQNAVETYLSDVGTIKEISLVERKDRQGEGKILITGFKMFDNQGEEIYSLISGQTVEFRIYYECVNNQKPKNVSVGIGISALTGQFLTLLSNEMTQKTFGAIPQKGYCTCKIDKLPLAPMIISVNLIVRQNDIIQDWIQNAASITIEGGDYYGTGRVTPSTHSGFLIEQTWHSHGMSDVS